LATAWDIACGIAVGLWLVVRHRLHVVHARSYVPSVMALTLKRLTGVKYLFDIRGFWADERVDGGLWPRDGRLYRIAKALERHFFQAADHVVTLTHASAREIAGFSYLQGRMPPITVIPTCVDLDRFRPQETAGKEPFTLGYVGSVGTWYLFDEVLCFFKAIRDRRPDARFFVVNRNEHDFIRAAVTSAGIQPEVFEIVAAEHKDVPALIARMSAGAAIIKPAYSKMASAPTKLAEYLGCGVPCIGNTKVGDVEEILEGERVGVVLTDFSEQDHAAAAERLLSLLDEPLLKARCVETAKKIFALDAGVDAYRVIYHRLASATAPTGADGSARTEKAR
jgi:glycosyltransferase involved in cell wall biosynthesis